VNPFARIQFDVARFLRFLRQLAVRPWRRADRARRRLVRIVTCVVIAIIMAPAAAAAGDSGVVWLQWLTMKDQHGFTIDDYAMTVGAGGVTDPTKWAANFLLTNFWDFYRLGIGVCIQMITWVLQFQALEMVRGPANSVATVLQDVVQSIGLVPVLGALSILISVALMYKGKTGAGLGEMATSIVIAGIVGTSLANPVSMVTGENGAIAQTQDAGAAIAVNVLHDSGGQNAPSAGADPQEAVQTAVSGGLIDAFIRKPQQLLSFGTVLDGKDVSAECKKSYEAWMKGHGMGDVKSACGDKVKKTVENPQNSLVGAVVVGPSTLFLGAWAFLLLLATLFLTGLAAFESAIFIKNVVQSILPGAHREAVFKGAATVLMCLAMLIVSVVILAVYILVVLGLFTNGSSAGIIQTFLMVDAISVAFLVGLAMHVFRVKKHGKKAGRAATQKISPRTLSHSSGRSVSGTIGGAARTGASMMRTRNMTKALATVGAGAATGGVAGAAMAAGKTTLKAKGANVLRKGVNGAGTVAKGTGTAARVATKYTVGAPVSVPRAARAAKETWGERKSAYAAQSQHLVDDLKSYGQRKQTQMRDGRKAVESYRDEYVGNLRAGGRAANRVAQTGATYLFAGGPQAARRHKELSADTTPPPPRYTEDGQRRSGASRVDVEQLAQQRERARLAQNAREEAIRRAQQPGGSAPRARRRWAPDRGTPSHHGASHTAAPANKRTGAETGASPAAKIASASTSATSTSKATSASRSTTAAASTSKTTSVSAGGSSSSTTSKRAASVSHPAGEEAAPAAGKTRVNPSTDVKKPAPNADAAAALRSQLSKPGTLQRKGGRVA